MADRFDSLSSVEAETPTGTWNWAKRFVDRMNNFERIWKLADLDLTGKAGHTVRVNATEDGFEITP